MPRRAPTTIWRASFVELWKLLILSTVVLVSIITFAAAVKPLADGKLGPLDALKFMALAAVPMLQFALPFAAGFAATLTYHRMAADNELLAAHAGGVSHRALLAPAAFTGVVLALGVWGLSEQVIPRFMRSMERLVTVDVSRLMVNTIENGETLRIGDRMVYADAIRRLGPDPRGIASDRLLLSGVGGIGVDEDGRVVEELTARSAAAFLYRGDAEGGAESVATNRPRRGTTDLVIRLNDMVLVRDGKIAPATADEFQIPWSVPNTFSDDPKFLTFGELRALRTEPERMNFIDERRRTLALHLGERATTEAIARELEEQGRVTLVDGDPAAGRQNAQTMSLVTIRAGGMVWDEKNTRWRLTPAGNSRLVRVERSRATGAVGGGQVFEAATAGLRTQVGRGADDAAAGAAEQSSDAVRLTLEMDQVATIAQNQPGAPGVAGKRESLVFSRLRLADDPVAGLMEKSSAELLAAAEPRVAGKDGAWVDEFIKTASDDLKKQIGSLQREVTGNQHLRLAMAASCFVIVFTSAVTAMRLPLGQALIVYLWSFFPALGTVVMITVGQRVVHRIDEIGLIVLWSAVAALGLYGLWALGVVKKH